MYGMAFTIAIPFFIATAIGLATYLADFPFGAFDFSENRGPLYNSAVVIPPWGMTFWDHHWYWVWVLHAVPIFWFFGLTKDAVNIYRVGALKLGLGTLYPSLHDEYDPDKSRRSGGSGSRSWRIRLANKIKNHLFE